MASTTYEHPGNVTAMYAAREQFRHLTKMVCDFVKVNKIGCLKPVFAKKSIIFALNIAFGVSKRNAGQLPQPFWLGAACGGSSCSVARCAARA